MESASSGGTSGSPVFLYRGSLQPNAYALFKLAGVMTGQSATVRPAVSVPDGGAIPASVANAGLAGIAVPPAARDPLRPGAPGPANEKPAAPPLRGRLPPPPPRPFLTPRGAPG